MLTVKAIDQDFYEGFIRQFIPERIIDIHTHIWLDSFRIDPRNSPVRAVTWPSLVKLIIANVGRAYCPEGRERAENPCEDKKYDV